MLYSVSLTSWESWTIRLFCRSAAIWAQRFSAVDSFPRAKLPPKFTELQRALTLFFHCLDSSPYALNNNTFVVRTVCAVRSSFMFYISSMGKMFKKHNSIINIGPPALLTAFSEEIVYFTASSQTSLQYELFLPMEKKTVMPLLLYHPPTPIPPFFKKWIQGHCFVSLLRKQLQCYSSYSMVAPYTGQLYIYAI